MSVQVYGDETRLVFNAGVGAPVSTLIDVRQIPNHWMLTMAPLRTLAGQQIAVAGIVLFTARLTLGHANRSMEVELDWPIEGGTAMVSCSSVKLEVTAPGTLILGAGVSTLDVVFRAWVCPADGPRQTIIPPPRSVDYGDIAAGATVTLRVPACARGYSVQVGAATAAGALRVSTLSATLVPFVVRTELWTVTVAVAPFAEVGLNQGGGQAPLRSVALPPNGGWLMLTNTTAATLTRTRVVYDLDLG